MRRRFKTRKFQNSEQKKLRINETNISSDSRELNQRCEVTGCVTEKLLDPKSRTFNYRQSQSGPSSLIRVFLCLIAMAFSTRRLMLVFSSDTTVFTSFH